MHPPPPRAGSKEGSEALRRESFRAIPHLGLPHPPQPLPAAADKGSVSACNGAGSSEGLTMDLSLAGVQSSRSNYYSLFACISLRYLLTGFDIKLPKKLGENRCVKGREAIRCLSWPVGTFFSSAKMMKIYLY